MIERAKIGWAFLGTVALITFSGCGQGGEPLKILNATVEVNPSGNAPMAVLCSFATAGPTEAVITVTAEGLSLTVGSKGGPTTNHSIPLLGLRADREHTVRISITDEGGNSGQLAEPLTFTLGPIPAYFPPIEVTIAEKDKMEPGYSLIEETNIAGAGQANSSEKLVCQRLCGEIHDEMRPANNVSRVFARPALWHPLGVPLRPFHSSARVEVPRLRRDPAVAVDGDDLGLKLLGGLLAHCELPVLCAALGLAGVAVAEVDRGAHGLSVVV